MAVLLNPRTGTIHATAVDGSRRALCDLSVTVPAKWTMLDYSHVTCDDCRLRIDRVEDEAYGGYDPTGHLDYRAVTVANALRREVGTKANDIYETISFADVTDLLANALFPGDFERQIDFCHWALDPTPPRGGVTHA